LKINRENTREQPIERRIQVIKLKPIEWLKREQINESASNRSEVNKKISENNGNDIEIKKEIASDEETESKNQYALERCDERLIEINGMPSAYNYDKQRIRIIQAEHANGEEDETNKKKSPRWMTHVQPILPSYFLHDKKPKTNYIIDENGQTANKQIVILNNTSRLRKTEERDADETDEDTPKDRIKKSARENNKTKNRQESGSSRSGDNKRHAATRTEREHSPVSDAEETERVTRAKKHSDSKETREKSGIPAGPTKSNIKKRKTANHHNEVDNDTKMEEKLRELSDKEEQLREEARQLMDVKKKTCQSIARKRNRIRELEGLIRMLKEAPTIDEDSDGDEQLIGLMRTVNQLPKETEHVAEKYIVVDEGTGMIMTINTSTAISSNVPMQLRDEKHVVITQNIKKNIIERIIEADWATKIIRCEMSKDNKEIPGTRQILPVLKINTKGPDNPTPRKQPDEEEMNELSTEPENENDNPESKDESTDNEVSRNKTTNKAIMQEHKDDICDKTQDKNETTEKTKVHEIKLKKMKIIKTIPKELKQLIDSANNETIIQEKTRRTKIKKSYAESSSDKSDDEICRFRKLSRRKHWNKGSAKRPKSSTTTDTPARPESESSEITIPDTPEEGGMRPTVTRAAEDPEGEAAEPRPSTSTARPS